MAAGDANAAIEIFLCVRDSRIFALVLQFLIAAHCWPFQRIFSVHLATDIDISNAKTQNDVEGKTCIFIYFLLTQR